MARARGKYKPEQAAKKQALVLESLQEGCSRAAACEAAGLPRRTFYNWLDSDPDFAEQVGSAETHSAETMESVIYSAGLKAETDPRYIRAAIRWLEQRGGWQRSAIDGDLDFDQFTDEELERIADGEDPVEVLLSTRAADTSGAEEK